MFFVYVTVAERIAEEGSVAYRSKRSSLEGGPAVRAPVDLLDGSQRKKLRTVVKGSDGKVSGCVTFFLYSLVLVING